MEKETEINKEETTVVAAGYEEPVSPEQEREKYNKKRHRNILIFTILIIAEAFTLFAFREDVRNNNLHYRAEKQIENSVSGKIKLPSGTYKGDTDFGYFDGSGEFSFKTGAIYTGTWEDNNLEGLATLKIPSEGTYEGAFIGSRKNGYGKFTWDDGTVYDGEWKNDMMEGQGVYTCGESIKYEGTFSENKFKTGTCSFSNDTGTYAVSYKDFDIDNIDIKFSDGSTYNGSSDGKTLTGNGIMVFPNGDNYTGNFTSGKRDGQGKYTWASGDIYDGHWKSDAMTGSGTYTYVSGSTASGTFTANVFTEGSYKVSNDIGIYDFSIKDGEAVTVNMEFKNGTSYSGDISDGKLTGNAQIKYSNGDKYSGKVLNGEKNGQGNYTWTSGASYDGAWEDDKMNGTGNYYYSEAENGYKLSGSFKNGVPDGSCSYYVTSAKSYKTDWSSGKCVKVYE